LVSGPIGNAIEFVAGSGGKVQCAPSALFEPTGAVSIALWTRGQSLGAWPSLAGRVRDNNWNDGYGLWGGGPVNFFVKGDPNTATAPITIGATNYVAGTYDGSTVRVYVNGVKGTDKSGVAGPINYTAPATFSIARLDEVDAYWNGMIDEVQLSSVARSSNWVWACYLNQASNAVFSTFGPMARASGPAGTVFTIR
jgi:hypothetical protein